MMNIKPETATALFSPASELCARSLAWQIDYVHISTGNLIMYGQEVPFSAKGILNAHFRHLAERVANATNATNGSNTTNSICQGMGTCAPVLPEFPPPMPPMLPPMPPLVPGPAGFTTVVNADQLRAAVSLTPVRGSLLLYLPPGIVLLLGGVPIVVSAIDLEIISDAEGATIDAQSSSRIFDVRSGARLQLRSLTLANGYSASTGGTISMQGGSITLAKRSSIVNSTADVNGGAIEVLSGILMMFDESSIVNATGSQGGSIIVNGGKVTMSNGCFIANSFASRAGGAIAMDGGSLTLAHGSYITNSSAAAAFVLAVGGAIALLPGAALTITDNSSIINSTSNACEPRSRLESAQPSTDTLFAFERANSHPSQMAAPSTLGAVMSPWRTIVLSSTRLALAAGQCASQVMRPW
jgi:hypothetical protein